MRTAAGWQRDERSAGSELLVLYLVELQGERCLLATVAAQRTSSTPFPYGLTYAYVEAFLEQVLVSVACNGAHSLKQRLARWLLTMRDRSDDDALQITQNLLAEMLGVYRPTVTNAARELERAGLIAERPLPAITLWNLHSQHGLRAVNATAQFLHDPFQPLLSTLGLDLVERPDAEMVAVASAIIKQRTGTFDPTTYRDRYQEAPRELIEAKMKGVAIKPRVVSTPPPVIDLMAALNFFPEPKAVLVPRAFRRRYHPRRDCPDGSPSGRASLAEVRKPRP